MSSRLTPNSAGEREVAQLFEVLARQYQLGGLEAAERLLAEHPAHADELRQLLPTLEMLGGMSRSGEAVSAFEAIENPFMLDGSAGILGDFQIVREIGRGGMGIVYEAQQTSLNRRVALKVLPFAAVLDPNQLRRFRNEAQAAAGLHHANIVPVYSVGCERGVHYYAMQFIDGVTVAQFIAAMRGSNLRVSTARGATAEMRDIADSLVPREPLPTTKLRSSVSDVEFESADARNADSGQLTAIRRGMGNEVPDTDPPGACRTENTRENPVLFRKIAELGVQVDEALDYAHQPGLVHRDIKPANLLIDFRGKVWIADFGLARIGNEANLTVTGDLLGTLRYMSPEQVLATRPLLDHRTDIYSLGITLYELLTFEPAFKDTDRQSLLQRIPQGVARPPRSIRPDVPADLETIVVKSIETEPPERYQTAAELADDLRRYLRDEPIRARRPTLLQRATKWSRRHRSIVVSSIAVLCLSMLGLAIGTILIARERNAAAAAAQREHVAAELARNDRRAAEQERDNARYNLYVADMHLAHQDWNSGQVERMLELLRAHVPHPGEVDLRGWEWRYLMALSRQDRATLNPESGKIASLAWSPDGRLLATGGDVVKIWDTSNLRLVRTIQGVATAVPGISGITSNVAWSPDGKKLATAAPGNMVRIWDPRDGTELLAHGPLEMQPTRICWRPDGRFLATGDRDGALLIWEAVPDSKPVRIRGKAAYIWSLAWSPDGKLLAAGDGYPGVLDVWDAVQNTLRHSFKAHGHVIMGLAWSPDGRHLATGSVDQRLKIWDTLTWEATVDRLAHSGGIRSVAWSPDGKRLVTGGDDSTVKIWDTSTGTPVNTLRGHVDHVHAAVWSPTGDRLASAGTDGSVKFWESDETQDVRQLSGSWPVVWSPNAERLVGTGYTKGSFRIFDTNTGKIVRQVNVDGLERFGAFDWQPSGNVIAAGNFGGELLLFDAESGRELWRKAGCHASTRADQLASVRSVAWNRDGSRLMSAGVDMSIKIWEPATGVLMETLRGHAAGLGSALWNLAGSRIASKDFDQSVKIWNTSTWREELHLRCHPFATFAADGRYSIAWSPDGSELAAGTSEGWIVVWNTTTGRERLAIRGHAVNIRSISWSPDGTRLATGSEDRRVRIWDAMTGREMLTLEGHKLVVMSVSWSPDGRCLASGNTINTVPENTEPAIRIWDATRGYDERP